MGSEATGIDGKDTETDVQDVYSVEGRKQNGTVRGLNIIRMEDGTVRKVAVK